MYRNYTHKNIKKKRIGQNNLDTLNKYTVSNDSSVFTECSKVFLMEFLESDRRLTRCPTEICTLLTTRLSVI